MARVNVYLPDDLADEVKDARLNVSSITQAALRVALDDMATDSWLEQLSRLDAVTVPREQVIAALDAARDEFGDRGGA